MADQHVATVTVDEVRLAAMIDRLAGEVCGVDEDGFLSLEEFDDVDIVVQELLGANMACVFDLPVGAQAVAHTFNDPDGPGFVFGLRPDPTQPGFTDLDDTVKWVTVTGMYVESVDVEPVDDQHRRPVDGGVFTPETAVRQIAEKIRDELDALVPAYQRLIGVTVGTVRS